MTTENHESPERYRFADLTFDVGQRRLRRGAEVVPLSKQTFKLLQVLAEAAPDVVSHDGLADKVWGPRRIVTPENLSQSIVRLRQALGDDATHPRYIESLRGQGYRLIPAVARMPIENETDAQATYQAPGRLGSRSRASRSIATGVPAFLGRRVNFVVTVLLVLVVTLLVVDNFVLRGLGGDRAALTAAPASVTTTSPLARPVSQSPADSLAVLPCANLSPNSDDAYIAAGIHAEILTQLAKIRAFELRSRTSVLRYANTEISIPEIAKALDVGAIVECGVRYADDRVRVSVQLVEAAADQQLWAEFYERGFAEIFTIQEEIATGIANALEAELSVVERERIARIPTSSIEAYALYLRSLTIIDTGYASTFQTAQTQRSARAYLDRAVSLDPSFALAHARKATTYSPSEVESTLAAAEAALSLDPNLGLAHAVRATGLASRRRFDAALQACGRAMEFDAADAEVLSRCAIAYVLAQRPDDAVLFADKSLVLDGDSVARLHDAHMVYLITGEIEKDETVVRRIVGLDRSSARAHLDFGGVLVARGERTEGLDHLRIGEQLLAEEARADLWAGYVYHVAGLADEAARAVGTWEELTPEYQLVTFPRILTGLAVGDHDRVLDEIFRAADAGDWDLGLALVKVNALNDPILDRPEFLSARQQLGLAD